MQKTGREARGPEAERPSKGTGVTRLERENFQMGNILDAVDVSSGILQQKSQELSIVDGLNLGGFGQKGKRTLKGGL